MLDLLQIKWSKIENEGDWKGHFFKVQKPKWTRVENIGTKMNILKAYWSKWTQAKSTRAKVVFKTFWKYK